MAAALALAACSSGGDDGGGGNGTPDGGSAVNSAEFTNSRGGVVSTSSGQSLVVDPGAVPESDSGADSPVTFSVESVQTPPAALPGDVDGLGSVAKFGPDGFDFAWPLTMTLPIPDSATNLTGLQYMRYDPGSSSWVRYPGMAYVADANGRVTGASVPAYDLGFDSLAVLKSAPGKADTGGVDGKLGSECTTCDGAMRWAVEDCRPENGQQCHYYFVAKSYTPREPWQKAAFESFNRQWYNRGNGCAWNSSTERFEASGDGNCAIWRSGSEPAGDPAPETIFPIMQGDWEFCVTKSQYVIPGGSLPLPGRWTYDTLVHVSISEASHNSCQTFECWSNVVNISLPTDGSWKEPDQLTSCPTNSNPSTLVGTGDFQATLTWVNTESHNTDLDLHLYGPNGVHVFYGASMSPDGRIELDTDWQEFPLGNAVENIYTTTGNSLPSGSYRLNVDHFSGSSPTSFTLRVVRDGVSQTYSRSIASGQDMDIVTFSE